MKVLTGSTGRSMTNGIESFSLWHGEKELLIIACDLRYSERKSLERDTNYRHGDRFASSDGQERLTIPCLPDGEALMLEWPASCVPRPSPAG